jgi:hypothetical protein
MIPRSAKLHASRNVHCDALKTTDAVHLLGVE